MESVLIVLLHGCPYIYFLTNPSLYFNVADEFRDDNWTHTVHWVTAKITYNREDNYPLNGYEHGYG